MDRVSTGNVEYALIIMNNYNELQLNRHRLDRPFKLNKLVLGRYVENNATSEIERKMRNFIGAS